MYLSTLVFALLASTSARADSEKRPVPDYDGRGNTDAQVHRKWSWIPRVLLWPAFAVNEYVLRRPLGWLVTTAERDRWLDTAVDAFSFGPRHDILLFPIVEYEWGFRTNAGFYYPGDNLFTRDNSIRIEAATGGVDYWSVTALDRYALDARTSVSTRFDFKRHSDILFFGLGPRVSDATRSRYGIQQLDLHTSLKQQRFGESWLELSAGARTVKYRNADCCGTDLTLDQRIANGTLATPPGYKVPYNVMYERAQIFLDSRPPRPAPGTGVYLRLNERYDFDISNDRGWIEYGGAVGGALDLDDQQRTLRLQAAVDFVDPIAGETPFNELAGLGSDLMPGFVGGWMLGRSTFATQLAYTWPITVWFDGEARASAGNAFDEHLQGLAPGLLRLSGDFGLTTSGQRDQGLEIVIGAGTEPIGDGFHITSVRLAIGSRGGF
jgi:hypothetical protein